MNARTTTEKQASGCPVDHSGATGPIEPPITDMPVDPGPFDVMPALLVAAKVAPVIRIPYLDKQAWVVCEEKLVREALTHPQLAKDITLVPEWMRKPGLMLGSQPDPEYARTMIMSDGEHHARIRRLHSGVLSPRNTEKWGERVGEKVDGFLDILEASATGDAAEVNVVTDYTHHIPLAFISEMLGLPSEARKQLRDITDVILYSSDYPARTASVRALYEAVEGWVHNPEPLDEGVITGLLAASDGPDAKVTEGEVVVWALAMIITGYETTGSLISASIYEAIRRPVEERPKTDDEINARWGAGTAGAPAASPPPRR